MTYLTRRSLASNMSASPQASAIPSSKRPLEDPSSPSAPTDLPEAKRPALDKVVKEDDAPKPSGGGGAGVKTEDSKVEPDVVNGSKDAYGDTVVSDAANGSMPDEKFLDGQQPIQSTAAQNDAAMMQNAQAMPIQDETNWIHLRAVISSAEAATCIGKGGENVSQIRRLSGAKCTVSDYSRGAVERILTVSGAQDAVAKVEILGIWLNQLLTNLAGFWFDHPHTQSGSP